LYLRICENSNQVKQINEQLKVSTPALICVGGDPIKITSIPNEWNQNEKYYYSNNHPILLLFGELNKGKAIRVGCIGDLDKWLQNEKKEWDYWVGALLIGVISIIPIIIRLKLNN
jgi:hypothetical protein